MTIGRGSFGMLNIGLIAAAVVGLALFVFAQSKVASPLIRLATFRDPALNRGFAMSALVSTVMMATLVVGPFYLSRALGLDAAATGLVLSIGPLAAALASTPAGRIVDRYGASRATGLGLAGMTIGCALLAILPMAFGIPGYLGPIVVVTIGYALFQTANNTAVMKDIAADRRGVISGLLNLSRNLGLITGASAMGAVFAAAVQTDDIAGASADAIGTGMKVTFLIAGLLIVAAGVIAAGNRGQSGRLG